MKYITSRWYGILFIPILYLGLFSGYEIGKGVFDYIQMRSWSEVQTLILSTHLEGNKSQKVITKYHYNWEGNNYTSTTIGIKTMSDNIESYHKKLHQKLNDAQVQKKFISAWINPLKPNESVLDRNLHWELICIKLLHLLFFGGFGLIGLWVIFSPSNPPTNDQKPWLSKKEWENGIILSETKTKMQVSLIGAVLWNLLITTVAFSAWEKIKNDPIGLVILIFVLTGICYAIMAVRSVISYYKYGSTSFQLGTFPGVIGGKFSGVIRIPPAVQPEKDYQLNLCCIHQYTTRNGKNSSTHEDILWESTQAIHPTLPKDSSGTQFLPVLFAIPYKCRPTQEIDDNKDNHRNAEIIWSLNVSVPTSGIDFECSFDVPIYKTEESRSDFQLDPQEAQSVSSLKREIKWQDAFQSEGILVSEPSPNKVHINFSRGRVSLYALTKLGISLSLAIASILIFIFEGSLFIPAIFILLSVFFLKSAWSLFVYHDVWEIHPKEILWQNNKQSTVRVKRTDQFKIKNDGR